MKKALLQRILTTQFFLGLVLVLGFSIATVEEAAAQRSNKPEIPVLSLTGLRVDYDDNVYPEGRLWLAKSANGPREFLLPVFIDNGWMTQTPTKEKFSADPIRSFKFTMKYDTALVRAVGVETMAEFQGFDIEGVAKDFNISFNDVEDISYMNRINPNYDQHVKNRGRAITITGTSSSFLPITSADDEEFKIMLFVRFRVMPNLKTTTIVPTSPIYIDNEEIIYNELNVCKEMPFSNVPGAEELYGLPKESTGLGGIDNEGTPQANSEKTVPGSIYIRVMDNLPKFDFEIRRAIGSNPAFEEQADTLWVMKDPITAPVSNDDIKGKRILEVKVSGDRSTTRLNDVTIESDQPWLSWEAVKLGSASRTFKNHDFIDNGIMGRLDPLGKTTAADLKVFIQAVCDPSKLEMSKPEKPEKAGIYVGHLTFKSENAEFSPVKVKITFIYFRNPMEPSETVVGDGIRLKVSNSEGTTGQSTNIVFGTGHRATDAVDMLFGETKYEYAKDGFGARWYPWPQENNPLTADIPFGFGDMNPNDEAPDYESRDIRDTSNTQQSIVYYCRFNANGDQNYPVKVEWDTKDFPDGAQLFIRDILNGKVLNATDMRRATPLGGSKFSYTIQDPNITEFLIEYTLATVISYTDEKGDPIIKKGWNLLSLPVNPHNKEATVVYKEAITTPTTYKEGTWQQEKNLKPGVGYFIKYHNKVDEKFAGSWLTDISVANGHAVRVYPGDVDKGGWNAIGALSVPVNIKNVDFTAFGAGDVPKKAYTLSYDVYEYIPNQGYTPVNIMNPGKGYFIKVDENGYLKLKKDAIKSSFAYNGQKENTVLTSTKLTVRDNSQNEGVLYITENTDINTDLYSMPPAPPAELFDVRFSNDTYLNNTSKSVINFNIKETSYPVAILVSNPATDLIFKDQVTGEPIGIVKAGKTGNVVVENAKTSAVTVEKLEVENTNVFSIANNPVVSSSTISYSVNRNEVVRISLFNQLGNKVADLANNSNVGTQTCQLDASNLAAGTYFVRLTSNSRTAIIKVSVVK